MKFSVEWKTPDTNKERMEYARQCADDLGVPEDIPVYIDDVATDAFNDVFKAWPTCYYVLDQDGHLLFKMEMPEFEASYDIRSLCRFVEQCDSKSSS